MGHIRRIETLQEMIKASDFSVVLLFYSRDVFYYTGTAQPCYLFVSPQNYCLFVRAGSDLALREAQIEKKNIKEERQLENIFKEISCTIRSEGRIGAELGARNVKVIAPSLLPHIPKRLVFELWYPFPKLMHTGTLRILFEPLVR